MGRGPAVHLNGMFAFALREDSRPHDPRPRPARRQAALPGRGRRRAARRVDAAGAAGGRRRRHARGPGRAAPLPLVALGGARAAHDPARRHASSRRRRCWSIEPDGAPLASASTGTRRSSAGSTSTTGRRRCARRSSAPCGAGWWPTSRSGSCSQRRPGLLADRRAARARGPDRAGDVLDRLRGRRRALRRRVRVLRPGRARVRHRPPPDADRPPAAGRRAAAGDRGHERADGLARLRRVLAAERSRPARAQGRPVRPGRRRGARRLRLVPAAARGFRTTGSRHLRGELLRPRRRGRPRAAGRRARRRRLARVRPRRGSPARAPPPRSTAPCGWTPR